jgi:hypothetical protein
VAALNEDPAHQPSEGDSNNEDRSKELSSDVYEVKRICGHRRNPKTGDIELKVAWTGFDCSEWDEWLDKEQLGNAPKAVDAYRKKLSKERDPWRTNAPRKSLSAVLRQIQTNQKIGAASPRRTWRNSSLASAATDQAPLDALPNRGITTASEQEEADADAEERKVRLSRDKEEAAAQAQREAQESMEEQAQQQEEETILSYIHDGTLEPEDATPLNRPVLTPAEW